MGGVEKDEYLGAIGMPADVANEGDREISAPTIEVDKQRSLVGADDRTTPE